MTATQARLYLDEDVDVLLVALLRARGYDVEHARSAGQLGMTDEAQLRHSTRNGRVLMTHNRVHFELLASEWFEHSKVHSGIIIAGRRPIYELTRRVLTLLASVGPDDMVNQIRYV